MTMKKGRPVPPRASTGLPYDLKEISPVEIWLDPQNPRLDDEQKGLGQEELLRLMIDEFKIEELARAVVESGYCPFDPLVGYEEKGRTIILEGNRRIAALKLLLNPQLAPERLRPRWMELSKLGTAQQGTYQVVSVMVFETRDMDQIQAYLGFRHVTGVLEWPVYERAQYIAQLVDTQDWNYKEVGDKLGIQPKNVEKHYVAFRIVRQAFEEEVPGARRMKDRFGVLVRALQTTGVISFVGVELLNDPEKSRNPVPQERLDDLRNLVRWTFGIDDEEKPLVRDSRQLTKWGKILESREAVRYLRSATNPTFERAWYKSGGQLESLEETLHAAADRLEEAVPLVPEYLTEEAIEKAVRRCTGLFAQIISHFPDLAREYKLKS